MVDAATASRRPAGRTGADATPAARGIAVALHAADTAGQAAYAAFCRQAVFAPPQSPEWLAAWAPHAEGETAIAEIRRNGATLAMLPLEIVRRRGLSLARPIGGRHANGNFPATAAGLPPLDAGTAGALAAALAAAGRRIDVVCLERMAERIAGQANPLAGLPRQQSPDVALAVALDGGFEALLERVNGKRKGKKHRSQKRKFEAVGGVRRLRAETPEEIARMLDAFFAMKHARFAQMGIADVFADEAVRAAFRALFGGEAGKARPAFVLHGLEVGGVLRAVTGSSAAPGRLVCEFGAIAADDLAHASPGDFLFFENIREACEEGFAVYDFSVGDEHYKRLWCDLEERQFDVVLPLTLRGRAYAAGRRLRTVLRRSAKQTPAVRALVRRLRRLSAAR